MRLPDLRALYDSLDNLVTEREAQEAAAVSEVSKDTLKFLEQYCKLKPYWYLIDLIRSYESFQFNAVRWPRQTGKSTDIGICTLPMHGIILI